MLHGPLCVGMESLTKKKLFISLPFRLARTHIAHVLIFINGLRCKRGVMRFVVVNTMNVLYIGMNLNVNLYYSSDSEHVTRYERRMAQAWTHTAKWPNDNFNDPKCQKLIHQ